METRHRLEGSGGTEASLVSANGQQGTFGSRNKSRLLVVLSVAMAVGCGDSGGGGGGDADAVATSLTRAVNFENGVVIQGALPTANLATLALQPSEPTLMLTPGATGTLALDIENGTEDDDPVETTLVRFGGIAQHIAVGRTSSAGSVGVAIENRFTMSDDVCDSLCNTTFDVPMTLAPRTRDGKVGRHVELNAKLDCTVSGDPAACSGGKTGTGTADGSAGNLPPPTDYNEDCGSFEGKGHLVPPSLSPPLDELDNWVAISRPKLTPYLEVSATFRRLKSDTVSTADSSMTVTVVANPYEAGFDGDYTLVNAAGGRISASCSFECMCALGGGDCSTPPCAYCGVNYDDLELEPGQAFIVFSSSSWGGIALGSYASVGEGKVHLATSRTGALNVCIEQVFISGVKMGEPGLGNLDEPYSGGSPRGAFSTY